MRAVSASPLFMLNPVRPSGHTSFGMGSRREYDDAYVPSVSKQLLSWINKSLVSEELKEAAKTPATGKEFALLLPYIQTGRVPPLQVEDFTEAIETAMDNYKDDNNAASGWHPNEAELMVLLNPIPHLTSHYVKQIVGALTSIDQWNSYHGIKNLPEVMIRLWGSIGTLSHSFRFWRHDAMGGPNSLFAKYGFQPMEIPETDKVFGKGYLYERANGTLLHFRRGYLLATHPEHGTLVIRNSSPAFGRDLLQHPAYYMKRSLSESDLKFFDPASDPRLVPILSPELFHEGAYKKKNIPALVKNILEVKQDYYRWKLDVNAFNEQRQFTGHLSSPGFKEIVRLLENKMAERDLGVSDKPLPVLAFVHPQYPPYTSYKFKDALGMEQEHFEITPKRLEELRDLVEDRWDSNKYADSDLARFLQAGISENAELILLSPE